jgi:hypothetical protein
LQKGWPYKRRWGWWGYCTDIINDAGRQAANKKQRKYKFYTHVLKVNINFQSKKKLPKNYQTQ